MPKVIKTLSIVILFVILLFGLLYFGGSKILPGISDSDLHESDTGVSVSDKVGQRASFFDLPSAKTGRIKLSDFEDTPLIIFFWSTWDENSSNQVKIFNDYLESESSRSAGFVKVVGIDSQEDKSIVASFIRRGGYSVPVVVDSSGAITESYGVKGLPTIFFIDRNGVIRSVWNGVLSVKQIVDKVEEILR
jgi:peroxiredoxin